MIQNFRGKNAKDTETAPETIISNKSFNGNIINNTLKSGMLSVTKQQTDNDNSETYMEKRKKLQ